jgi:hypothetical protein
MFPENQDGEHNGNWKGGISKEFYRYKLTQKARYPEKLHARNMTYTWIRRGKIIKEPCCICGDINSVAHHENYSKPKEITWLCREHHKQLHKSLPSTSAA